MFGWSACKETVQNLGVIMPLSQTDAEPIVLRQRDRDRIRRVQRSAMISATGVSVRRDAMLQRQGLNRGARTSTVPNSEFNRQVPDVLQ